MRADFIRLSILLFLRTPLILFHLILLIKFRTLETFFCFLGAISFLLVVQFVLSQLDRLNHANRIISNVIEPYPNAIFTQIDTSEYLPLVHVMQYFKRQSAMNMLEEMEFNIKKPNNYDKTKIILVNDPENPFVNIASFYNMQEDAYIFIPDDTVPNSPVDKYIAYHEIAHSSFLSRRMEVNNTHEQYAILVALFIIPFYLLWSLQSGLLFAMYVLLSSEFAGKYIERKNIKARIHAELFADQIALDIMNNEDKKELRKIIRKSLSRGRLIIYDDEMEYPANIMRIAKLGNLTKTNEKDEKIETSIETELEVNELEDSKFNTLWFSLLIIVLGLNSYSPSYYHAISLAVLTILAYCYGKVIQEKWAKSYLSILDRMNISL